MRRLCVLFCLWRRQGRVQFPAQTTLSNCYLCPIHLLGSPPSLGDAWHAYAIRNDNQRVLCRTPLEKSPSVALAAPATQDVFCFVLYNLYVYIDMCAPRDTFLFLFIFPFCRHSVVDALLYRSVIHMQSCTSAPCLPLVPTAALAALL